MDENKVLIYLQEMENRLQKQMEEMKTEIIDEIETMLMEIGVYKKEIIEKLRINADKSVGKD